jgi:hypothetical protein
MSWSCRRPGCGEPATVVVSFATASREVFVDALRGANEQAGQLLCERHRVRLTPPRGWQLVDQSDDPQRSLPFPLTIPRREWGATGVGAGSRIGNGRAPRPWPPLTFADVPAPDAALIESETVVEETTASSRTEDLEYQNDPTATEADVHELVDPPEQPAQSDTQSDEIDAAGEAETADDAESAEQNEPEIDERMAQLLKPTGGLLARAFGNAGPQRSILNPATDSATE